MNILNKLFGRRKTVLKPEVDSYVEKQINSFVELHRAASNNVWAKAEVISNRKEAENFLDFTSEERALCTSIENGMLELSEKIEADGDAHIVEFASRAMRIICHSQNMVTSAMHLARIKHMGYR